MANVVSLDPSGTLDVGLDRVYPYTLYPLVSNNLPVLAADANASASSSLAERALARA